MARRRETHNITASYAQQARHVSWSDRKRRTDVRDIRWDSHVAHLGLRIYRSGKKVWVVEYLSPINGGRRFMSLREFPEMSPDWARQEARRNLVAVDQGVDPQVVAEERKTDPDFLTWNQLLDAAEEGYYARLKRATSRACYVEDLRQRWGERTVASVRSAETESAWLEVAENRGNSAARAWDAVRYGTLNWALTRARPRALESPSGWTPPKVSGELKQERPERCRGGRVEYVQPGDIDAVWKRLDVLPWRQAAVLKLMLLTGHRSGTLRQLRWSEIEREHSRIRAVRHKTASKKGPIWITLSPPAMEIVLGLPRAIGSDLLFPGGRERDLTLDEPVSYEIVWQAWCRVREKLELRGKDGDYLKPHDLRHSVASYLVSQGYTLDEIKGVGGWADRRSVER